MKLNNYIFATMCASVSLAQAQSSAPATDSSLINVETPTILTKGQASGTAELGIFGGYDKSLKGDFEYGYGFGHHLEVDLAGTFGKWSSATGTGGSIRFGGTDEELSVRYHVPKFFVPTTVQVGMDYLQTPAQPQKIATTVGASMGYSPAAKLRTYLNPKWLVLNHNSLIGVGVGAAYDILPKITLIADWTPIIAGDNTLSTQNGNRTKGQLYSVGVRLADYFNSKIDFGVTNSTGITTASSLTPTLGDSPSLFLRLTHRF